MVSPTYFFHFLKTLPMNSVCEVKKNPSAAMVKGLAKKTFPRVPQVIKVGGDCGGLNTLDIAMNRIPDRSQYSYEFTSEKLDASRRLAKARDHKPLVWYGEVAKGGP